MNYLQLVHEFAIKWCDKFRDQNIHYIELVDRYMADDCDALGFVMDCGHGFSEKYGNAANNYEALDKIIDEVDDIQLLGSAIFSQWRYFNHWAYDAADILKVENRAWFILALGRLALLSGENPFIFKGELKKIRIVSDSSCHGPMPEPDEEIEQRLTINREGRVWFSAYNFGDGYDRHQKARTKNFKIDKYATERIMSSVSRYFSEGYEELYVTDIGDWIMELTNTEGKVYKFRGALSSRFDVDGTDLSDLIRMELRMPDLYVFDGNGKPDIIERITVDYHRLTKIEMRETNADGTPKYMTWDYTEQLILDRETETIEHIQNIGTECKVSRKYEVQGGVEALLDELEAESFFMDVEGNPEDVVVNPLDMKEYVIKVDYAKGPQRIIEGSYDKKGLPSDFEEFADTVFDFMRFYGLGEILDPSVYGKVHRRNNEYIFCSVIFDSGYKSYYYITDDDKIDVGDYVLVPAGADNHESIVEVVKIEYFTKENAPLAVEKCKKIIRKCKREDFERK